MGEVITIGLDIAKSVFQVDGVDVDGAVVIRKRFGQFCCDAQRCPLVGSSSTGNFR